MRAATPVGVSRESYPVTPPPPCQVRQTRAGVTPAVAVRVEPRGFEPLTSAVQSQSHNVAIVRQCSKSAAKSRIYLQEYSCMFAVVRVGWCTTGVNETR